MSSISKNCGNEVVDPGSLLGEPDESVDWVLDPSSHADRLDVRAAALSRILNDEVIKEIMRRYDRRDESAAIHQETYKRYGKLEIYLGTAAALLGAVVLSLTDPGNLTPAAGGIRTVLLTIQIACAAGVVGVKYILRNKKSFVKWQVERSAAETARIELFETVCGMTDRKWDDVENEGDYPLLPLQLEYFVRYQLMVQVVYYDKRGKQHQAAADRFISIGAVITFVAALAAGFLALTNELGDGVSIASIAALVAPVLFAGQTSLSRLNQDERNAARYGITHEHLDRLRGRLSDVRRQAAGGNADAVYDFVRSVDQIISVEHSQWTTQQSEAAVAQQQAIEAERS